MVGEKSSHNFLVSSTFFRFFKDDEKEQEAKKKKAFRNCNIQPAIKFSMFREVREKFCFKRDKSFGMRLEAGGVFLIA